MPESYNEGDLPSEAGQASEAQEATSERFREQRKKAQASAKKAQIQERKAKGYDNTLAQVVTAILQKGGNDTIIILIADLIENNVPSDLLLAVLSLEYEDANTYIQKQQVALQSNENVQTLVQASKSIQVAQPLPNNLKELLDTWWESIKELSFKDAEKVLETIIDAHSWKIHPSLINLTTHIILQFASNKGISIEFSAIHEFCEQFFEKLLEKLQNTLS